MLLLLCSSLCVFGSALTPRAQSYHKAASRRAKFDKQEKNYIPNDYSHTFLGKPNEISRNNSKTNLPYATKSSPFQKHKHIDEIQKFSCGTDCTYELNTETGELIISSPGEIDDYSNPDFDRKIVKAVIINPGMTSLDSYMFSDYSNVVSIVIPNTVTTIGEDTFHECISLESITVNDGNQNYKTEDGVLFSKDMMTLIKYPANKNLDSYEIPNDVTSIYPDAFSYCSNLVSIEIPSSVQQIFPSMFYGYFHECSNLESINVNIENQNFQSIKGVLFSKDKENLIKYPPKLSSTVYAIPGSVTSIYSYAFYGCSSLELITIPESVTYIGIYAFYCCSSLTSIEIPNGETSIGRYTFYGCSSLESIQIPDSVTSIHDYVFQNCSSLKSIQIPDNVTSIGHYVFQYCSSLENITIPNGVTSIGDYVFQYCSSLENITIPDSVTSIGYYVFQYCSSLGSIEIPESVTSISSYAFANCSSLESIKIPDSATLIGYYAFANCSSLESINISNSVTSIYDYAFQYCSSLVSIEIPASVTNIGRGVFASCSSLESITIQNGNQNYRTVDGILFSMEALVVVYSNKQKLTSYVIPNGVTSIDDYAFQDCSNLESIEIPGSVTYIGGGAFYSCTNLRTVTFHGPRQPGYNLPLPFETCPNLQPIKITNNEYYHYTVDGEFVTTFCGVPIVPEPKEPVPVGAIAGIVIACVVVVGAVIALVVYFCVCKKKKNDESIDENNPAEP